MKLSEADGYIGMEYFENGIEINPAELRRLCLYGVPAVERTGIFKGQGHHMNFRISKTTHDKIVGIMEKAKGWYPSEAACKRAITAIGIKVLLDVLNSEGELDQDINAIHLLSFAAEQERLNEMKKNAERLLVGSHDPKVQEICRNFIERYKKGENH